MSADNGIYVLESPTKNGSQYRVAHCSAIENMDYFEQGTVQAKAMLVHYFGNSEVYISAHEVMKAALKLHNEVKYTEYGIRCLAIRLEAFPSMSVEEAENVLKAA